MRSTNERRCCNATSSRIGWAYAQNDPCYSTELIISKCSLFYADGISIDSCLHISTCYLTMVCIYLILKLKCFALMYWTFDWQVFTYLILCIFCMYLLNALTNIRIFYLYTCMMTSSNGNIFRSHGPFVRWIHRSPVNSQHKSQWCGALMFSLICAWTNNWANDGDPGDLRRHHAHYGVIVMEYS